MPRGFVVGPGSETSGDSVFGLYGDLMNLEVSATSGVSVFCLFGDLMNLEVSVTSEVSVFGLSGDLMKQEESVNSEDSVFGLYGNLMRLEVSLASSDCVFGLYRNLNEPRGKFLAFCPPTLDSSGLAIVSEVRKFAVSIGSIRLYIRFWLKIRPLHRITRRWKGM